MSANTGSYQSYLKLEQMIADCASFQSLTGTANSTDAKARIKFIACQDFDTTTRGTNKTYQNIPMPRAAIWNVNPSKERTSFGHYSCQLNMIFSLEIEIPSNVGTTHDEEFRYCGPLYEAVEDELAELSFIPTNLQFARIGYLQSPAPIDPKQTIGRRIWAADLSLQTRW